jgi:predicted Zn-dependent protease
MQYSRCLVVSIALVAASICLPASYRGAATVLPEVRKHLDAGHKNVADGSWEIAAAHADVVLISDSVSVYVNVDNVSAAQRQTCLRALSAALAKWQSALDDTIQFHMQDDPAKADLKVTFRSDVRLQRETVAGLTNWSRSIRSTGSRVTEASFKADVQIRARDLDFQPLPFEAMRQEAEHEFGHILGLDDSDHLGDLMGRFDAAHLVSGPRDYEVLAVKNIRSEAKRIKADAQKGSLDR